MNEATSSSDSPAVTLDDLVSSDTFCEIQRYLDLEDFFAVRCLNRSFRDYIDKELTKLKQLQLTSQHEKVTNAFKVLSERCCHLNKINLNRSEWIRDDLLLPMLRQNAKTLTSLSLNNCPCLTAVALQPVIIDCKKLKTLSLQNCDWLTGLCLHFSITSN